MLSLSGNSETAFATLNSVNVNPLAYIEWNYNNITKPYIVYSSSTTSNSNAVSLNNSASWTSVNGSISTLSTGGNVNEIDTSASCLKLSLNINKYSDTFSSSFSVPLGSGYYKIVLYLKSYTKNTYGSIAPIKSLSLSSAGAGTTTGTIRYNIIPSNIYSQRSIIDINNSISGSIAVTSASGVNVKWAVTEGPVAFDIYRSISNSSYLPFVTTIPATNDIISSGSYTYNDNFANIATSISANPTESMKISVSPSIRLSNSGTQLTNIHYYSRVLSDETLSLEKISNSIELDGSKYYRVEVVFGSDETFNNINLDLSVEAPFVNGSLLLCNAEMFKTDGWNFANTDYYPIESVFDANRPAEALLHPYIQTKDQYVNYGYSSQKQKPATPIFFSPDDFFSNTQPYKQAHNSIFNKFKYYISPDSSTGVNAIRAQYKNYLDINKIVIKTSNAVEDMTKISGSIQVLGPNYSVLTTIPLPVGAFDSSGIAVAYFDGIAWTASSAFSGRGNWKPPSLTDSGILQNVTSSVTGLVYISNFPNPSDSRNSASVYVNPTNRIHVVEISPRLELDISELIESLNVSKTMDDSDSVAGFPLGYMNSNQGSLGISNIPVYKNGFPQTIFDNISQTATFSDILRQGVKFTVGLISPTNDFTEFVPFMTMYSDSWSIKDIDSLSVDLYDAGKSFLMGQQAPEYLCTSENVFSTITNILDISGFTDYDYDSLKEILNKKNKMVNAFWCDKTQTVFEVLKSFFIAHQIGASFDEYGILRFYDLDKYIYQYTSNNFTPDFSVNDVPVLLNKSTSSVYYEANLIKDSYNVTIDKKIGTVTVDYSIPIKNFTANTPKNKAIGARVTDTPTHGTYVETNDTALIRSYASRSLFASEKKMYLDPHIAMSSKLLGHTIEESGMAFLQGELISWNGLEYVFVATNVNGATVQSIKKIIKNPGDKQAFADEIISSIPTVTSVEYYPTGWVVGLQRGLRNTKPRNHIRFDDTVNKKSHLYSTTSNFKSMIIYGSGSAQRVNAASGAARATYGDSIVTMHSNIAKFRVHKPKSKARHLLALVPVKNNSQGEFAAPTSASSFDYFSFVFKGPDLRNQKFTHDKSVIEVGFYINHRTSPIILGIRNVADKNAKNHSWLAVNNFSVTGVKAKTSSGANSVLHDSPFQRLSIDVFDGQPHRIELYIDYSTSKCYFYINKKMYGHYDIVGNKGAKIDKSGSSDWGVYVENLEKTFMNVRGDEKELNVFVTEMYAYDYSSLGVGQYSALKTMYPPVYTPYNFHWHNPYYLDQLVKNSPNCEPNYYYWGPLDLFGVKFYDKVAYQTSPVIPKTAHIDPHLGYSSDYAGSFEVLKAATLKDVAKSNVFSTPFRFSCMLVNDNRNNQLVWLAKGKGTQGPEVTPFTIGSDFIKHNDSVQIDKIINPSNLQNSVILKTDWLQSSQEAEKLLETAVFFANSFSTTVNVQLFGNPLLQVGDICQFIYTKKRIGYDPENASIAPLFFLVKEVNQDFTGGLTTNLSLRPLFNTNSTSIA